MFQPDADEAVRSEASRLQAWYAAIGPLCVARLCDSYDAETHLFTRQLRGGAWGPTLGTESITSTAICLIALDRAKVRLPARGFSAPRAAGAVLDALRARRYLGALGLALWANATLGGQGLAVALERAGVSLSSPRRLAARLTTMELAWLVSGLLHERRRARGPLLESALGAALAELTRRQMRSGLFAHASRAGRPLDRARRYVANFADQIYPVQALAFAALALEQPRYREAARRCAQKLVELQGDLGQWWWQYEPRGGTVVRRYPVYSVHQHGMAPMALLALRAAGGPDLLARAWDGLGWLRRNELGASLVDSRAQTVWRSIELKQTRLERLRRDVLALLGSREPVDAGAKPCLLNRETRPYEWGWALYAGAVLAQPRPVDHWT